MHPIQTMIERYHAGQHAGIYSCCCANELVIRAVMQQALWQRGSHRGDGQSGQSRRRLYRHDAG